MTDPRGNSDLFLPWGPFIKCFVIPTNSKIKKTAKNDLLDAGWHTNLSRFKGALPYHVTVASEF